MNLLHKTAVKSEWGRFIYKDIPAGYMAGAKQSIQKAEYQKLWNKTKTQLDGLKEDTVLSGVSREEKFNGSVLISTQIAKMLGETGSWEKMGDYPKTKFIMKKLTEMGLKINDPRLFVGKKLLISNGEVSIIDTASSKEKKKEIDTTKKAKSIKTTPIIKIEDNDAELDDDLASILKQQEALLKKKQEELAQAKRDSIDNAEAQKILEQQGIELKKQLEELEKARQDSIEKVAALKLQEQQEEASKKQQEELDKVTKETPIINVEDDDLDIKETPKKIDPFTKKEWRETLEIPSIKQDPIDKAAALKLQEQQEEASKKQQEELDKVTKETPIINVEDDDLDIKETPKKIDPFTKKEWREALEIPSIKQDPIDKATALKLQEQQEETLKKQQEELVKAKQDSIDNAEAQKILEQQGIELKKQLEELEKAKQDSIEKVAALKSQEQQEEALKKQQEELEKTKQDSIDKAAALKSQEQQEEALKKQEKSMEGLAIAEKTLLQKGMSPDTLKFIKGRESENRTVEGLLAERGYLMEVVKPTEQAQLNIKYSSALQKIDGSENSPIGTYSLVLDAGKNLQKGYLVKKGERGWSFEKRFPISTGKKGISNIAGSQGTPEGLVFVKNIINGHLDEIIKHKTPQGKNSTLNGPATVNTTALVLVSGESKNSSIANRGIYFHETEKISKLGIRDSGACIRTGTFIATEIGQYIKENSLEKTPIYIANTEVSESLVNNEVTELAEKLINSAKEFEGHPYDTSWDDRDGFASVNTVNGKYRYLDNFTGEKKETDKKPLVCIDLVVQSLLKTKSIPSLERAMKKGNFYMRRTTNFEKLVAQNPQDFSITHPNIICKFPEKKLSKKVLIQEGDILTTTNLETGGRHIGIVTEVDSQGIPLKMIHSNYKGVGETPFFNSTEVVDANHGKKRYDGFLAKTTRIDSVIRLKNNELLTSNN